MTATTAATIDSSLAAVRRAGRDGAAYLACNLRADGRFNYLVDPGSGCRQPGYNLLRHAGALLALAIWSREEAGLDAGQAIAGAARFLLGRVEPAGPRNLPCLASKGRAKLGGTALTLLALLDPAVACEAGDACEGLADYLLSQQEPSGRFRSVLRIDGREPSAFASAYYPGQAVLALLDYARAAGSRRHRAAALLGARWLAAEPLPRGDAADHWTIVALETAHRLDPRPEYAVRVIARSEAILRHVLADRGGLHVADADYGCAPAATRGEALAAAARLADRIGAPEAAFRFREGLAAIVHFCRRHQWREGPCAGGFRRSRTDPRVRIDTVQHAIIAIHGLVERGSAHSGQPLLS